MRGLPGRAGLGRAGRPPGACPADPPDPHPGAFTASPWAVPPVSSGMGSQPENNAPATRATWKWVTCEGLGSPTGRGPGGGLQSSLANTGLWLCSQRGRHVGTGVGTGYRGMDTVGTPGGAVATGAHSSGLVGLERSGRWLSHQHWCHAALWVRGPRRGKPSATRSDSFWMAVPSWWLGTDTLHYLK